MQTEVNLNTYQDLLLLSRWPPGDTHLHTHTQNGWEISAKPCLSVPRSSLQVDIHGHSSIRTTRTAPTQDAACSCMETTLTTTEFVVYHDVLIDVSRNSDYVFISAP